LVLATEQRVDVEATNVDSRVEIGIIE